MFGKDYHELENPKEINEPPKSLTLNKYEIERRVLLEKVTIGKFIKHGGFDTIRRPKDASQGLLKSNGIIGFHIVCAIFLLLF